MRKDNKYQIIELTKDTDDEVWQMRLDFYNLNRHLTDNKYANIDEYQQLVFKNLAEKEFYASCLLFKHDQLRGVFEVQLPVTENCKKEIFINLIVGQLPIDCELLTALLNYVKQKTPGDYQVNCQTNGLLNNDLRNKFNFKTKLDLDVYLLKKEKLNNQLLNKWQNNAEENNKDLRLELFHELPDELIDNYSEFLTGLYNDVPTPEIPTIYNITGDRTRRSQKIHDERGDITCRLLAFGKQNQFVGNSIVFVIKKTEDYPYQSMTGVIKEYRNRGIGKWMKAVLSKLIFEKHPNIEGLITEVFPYNTNMVEINRQIGYEKVGEKGEYIITKEDFNKWRTNHEIL